ncbi:hypothetical protein ACHAO7_011147 [Fusarium culmorum]
MEQQSGSPVASMSEAERGRAIGIDLGTSNSCAFVEGVAVSTGYNQTVSQSIVRVEENGLWTVPGRGHSCDRWSYDLRFSKRFIGRTIMDGSLETDAQTVQHVVMSGEEALYEIAGKHIKPIEVSAFLLANMRQLATNQFGVPFDDAIISVPAYFNLAQKAATRTAAEIADFKKITIIEEPVAAAIDYADRHPTNDGFYLLVVDIGAGTTDLALVYVENNSFVVKATEGRNDMAGSYLTRRVMAAAVEKWKKQGGCKEDLDEEKLERECEIQKEAMSSPTLEQISIPMCLKDDRAKPKRILLTRAEFDIACEPLWKVVREKINKIFEDSGQSWSSLRAIVLTGGSCALPRIRQICEEECPNADYSTEDPERRVGRGLGAVTKKPDLDVVPVLPRSVGIESVRDEDSNDVETNVILVRNKPIPANFTKCFYTKKGQRVVEIALSEGEQNDASQNTVLGTTLINVPKPYDSGRAIEVNIEVERADEITVKAHLKNGGKRKKGAIKRSRTNPLVVRTEERLSRTEIDVLRERTQQRLSGKSEYIADEETDANHPMIVEREHQTESTEDSGISKERANNTGDGLGTGAEPSKATDGGTESELVTRSAETKNPGMDEEHESDGEDADGEKEAPHSLNGEVRESGVLDNDANKNGQVSAGTAEEENIEDQGGDAEGEPVDVYEDIGPPEPNEQGDPNADKSARAEQRSGEQDTERGDKGTEQDEEAHRQSTGSDEGREKTMAGGLANGTGNLTQPKGAKRRNSVTTADSSSKRRKDVTAN